MEKRKKTDKKLNELTLLSTPKPISSSTVTKKKSPDLHIDSSFGLISINSNDLDLVPDRLSYLSKHADDIHENARATLARVSATGLSSKYLKPTTDFTTTTNFTRANPDRSSTINESDLVFSKDSISVTSTPRCSKTDTIDKPSTNKVPNLGETMARLSAALLASKDRLSLDDFAMQFQKSCNSFKPAEEMLPQLQQDELEWKNEHSLPIFERKSDLSASNFNNSKVSVGAFFYKKSDNLGEILAKSPVKDHKPIALIDETTTTTATNATPTKNDEIWSISKIQQILDATETSTNQALNMFKPKKFTNLNDFEEKENIDNNIIVIDDNPKIVRVQSPNSETLRSSSSLSQLPNGKLPVETTNRELIWDCVKIGKDVAQQFSIRNKSNAKLRIQCALSDPVFKIKETSDFEYHSIIKLILHPYETKTISVRFSPMSIGACIDEINFQSIDLQHEQLHKQSIKLYGYGGCGTLTVNNTFKDASGKSLLSLGTIIDNQQEFKQSFVLRNSGNLPVFAVCNFQLKTMYKFANIDVKPKKLILLPQQERWIHVVLQPTRADLRYIRDCQQFVIDLGVITLITGTEVNRGRIRRLCRKLLENNQNLDELCQQLNDEFPNESMPNDLKLIKEPVQYLEQLLTNLNKQEITVILENDCDTTIVDDLNDHTVTFHSFIGPNDYNNTQYFDVDRKLWKIEPNVIILTKQKISDIIVITSTNNKIINYEILTDCYELDISPKSGQIQPNENLFIGIKLRKKLQHNQNFNVTIRIDDDTFTVVVKVLL